MVEMQLTRIVIRESSDQQCVFLKEVGGSREFPIVIGVSEATAIDRNVREARLPRPMTHDLLAKVITELGATVERVVVCDLQQNTFYAELVLLSPLGETIHVDARPSDSLALAAHFACPIFVEDRVLEDVLPESSAD